MSKVAILGGGYVGRIAAWACLNAGATPFIFDREQEAKAPTGFVYLHDRMDLPLRAESLEVSYLGTAEEYAMKLYGDPKHSNSFRNRLGSEEIIYSPKQALDLINGYTHSQVRLGELKPSNETVEQLLEGYDKVIWTLPRTLLEPDLKYVVASVVTYPEEVRLPNHCVYSSDADIPWSRAGSMFGYAFYEFPRAVPGHRQVIKVIPEKLPETSHQGRTLYTGRYGSWTKMLGHEVYDHVRDYLTT